MTVDAQVTFHVRVDAGGGVALEQVGGSFHRSIPPEVVSRSSILREVADLSDEQGVLVAPSGFVEAWLQFAEQSYSALAGNSHQGLAVSLMVRSKTSTHALLATYAAL
jgi:hypothetical protein